MIYDDAPAWLKAADAHAIAAENTSIFEDMASVVENTPSFLAVSIASGLNSFYNTGVAVGNIFTEEETAFQQNDTGEWISSMDEDLGKYYQENKSAADITGFIGTSLIPGTLAIKGLKAAQGAARISAAGQVGSNFSKATSLLAPSMETYVKREAADLAAKSASFSFMHQNSLKALAAGAWQGTLEGVAFETAVAATMFKSPILEDMDVGDIVKNGLMWGAAGGVIGGIAGAASTYFGVGRLLQRADITARPFTGSTTLTQARAHLPSDKIVQAAADLEVLENLIPTPEFVTAQKLAAGETGESILPHVVAGEVGKLERLRTTNMQNLRNEMRTAAREMTKGDDVLGNQITDVVDKLGAQGIQKVFFQAKEFVRAGDNTAFEQLLKDMVKEGTFKDLKQARKLMQNEAVTTHIRLHSGGIGDEVAGKIGAHRLADDLSPNALEKLVDRNPFKPSTRVDYRTKLDLRAAELRYIAARSSQFPVNFEKVKVGSHDIPVLEKAIRQGAEKVTLELQGGATRLLNSTDEIREYIVLAKGEVIQAQKELGSNSEIIEIISDVRKDFIEGTNPGTDLDHTFFAQRSYAQEASKFHGREIGEVELAKMPRWTKVVYDNKTITDDDGMIMKGMEIIKHREKLAKQATENYFINYAKEIGRIFPDIPEDVLRSMWRGETGAGVITNAGGAYGSMSQMAGYIGDLTSELSKVKINQVTEEIASVAQGLLQYPDDAVRFSTINAIKQSTPEQYVLDDLGENLIPYKFKQWMEANQVSSRDLVTGRYAHRVETEPPTLFEGSPEVIPLQTERVRAAVAKHIQLSDQRQVYKRALNAVQGNTDDKLQGVFRPIRPDARDYKHVAFVKDETLVGAGHTRMLFAQTAEDLESQIAKVNEIGRYKVYTKTDAEGFYKARGDYEYDKTLHENYIDTDLMSRGIQSNFLPPTDPQKIVNQFLQQHVREENALLKQSIRVRYQKEVNELERLATGWDGARTSRIGTRSIEEILTSNDKNPYTAMIKSMFNTTKIEEMPAWLRTFNELADGYVSKAWNSAEEAFATAAQKGALAPEAIDKVNKIFEDLGFRSAYYDTATTLLANAKVPRGVLTGFVRKANAFLTTTILRLDAFNAVNNLVGNSVLYSSELKGLTDAIKKGSKEGAGELARLGNLKLPGVDDETFSPLKLMAKSIERLHGPDKDALIKEYKLRGLAPDLSDQYYRSLDSMTLNGLESIADMNKKSAQLDEVAANFAKWGEKATGNKWAEQFNRLIAADTMKQITEIAVKNGIIDEKTAWAYVATFSKRVNGVIRAAERPLMFQGPIGQAMGLFQSYQINLLQQVFRNIGEGRGKSIAMMAGMQGSVFGASSLPGFNLINSQLVGDAAGNSEHYDLFSATKAIFGQTGADWIMYGAPSNILRASLYTRGDTNPRTWHVVPNPTNPSEIPFISAFAKAFGSIKQAAGQVAEGAPLWGSFLSGVEHLGLSRPLAGLAATARALDGGDVISTQRNGNIAGSNDFLSLATLIRVAGAKPIDEAIVTNGYFRINAYAEKDRLRREELGSAVKEGIIDGRDFSQDEIRDFARAYVEKGGSATGFNQWWMNQYKNATKTQAQQMVQKLDDPYARRMQEVMGGRESMFDVGSF